PFSGSRYPEKWVKYIEYMVEGYTLPKIAEELGIHISTAFYWRHKILNALKSLGFDTLQGIVESDETFFRESMKGRKVTHRKPRKQKKSYRLVRSQCKLNKAPICEAWWWRFERGVGDG